MSKAYARRKPMRHSFGRIPQVMEIPNLISIQKQSYNHFLQMDVDEDERKNVGLESVFKSVFPIEDFSGTAILEFISYAFGKPKYDIEECQQRGMTFSTALKIKLRLVVFDVEEDTGVKTIKNIKEQDVYMGDLPLMTGNGTFVVNGTERVVVSQMHRSPGVFFDHDNGKTHSSGKLLFNARIIPYRGSWLDFEFDAKDILFARIDRRRKIPATVILHALDYTDEEILGLFYNQTTFTHTKGKWVTTFDAKSRQGTKPVYDIIDAKTGEVVVEAGKNITARLVRKLEEGKVKNIVCAVEEILGQFLAQNIVNSDTGEIYAEAGAEITDELLEVLLSIGLTKITILDVYANDKGPFIRNTLFADKSSDKLSALEEIYRVMRPGEPPTEETAEALFKSLFFDAERYDLSDVGRVKMNLRLSLDAADDVGILRKEDIVAVMQTLVDLRDGKGNVDDIDHLGNRRVRSVGELMENQYRIGLLRMDRAIKERMSSADVDTVMPQDLIHTKPIMAAIREFFGSPLIHQQNEPVDYQDGQYHQHYLYHHANQQEFALQQQYLLFVEYPHHPLHLKKGVNSFSHGQHLKDHNAQHQKIDF